jgi:hypothetical protein
MHFASAIGLGAVLGVIYAFVPAAPTGSTAIRAAALRATPSSAQPGHLVLVVAGNCQRLDVVAAVRKTDPFGGVPKGLTSNYELSIRDAQGQELGRFPLDLARFDLDPTHVGRGPTVQGDQVRSPQIALPVSVPDFAAADSIVVLHDQLPIAAVSGSTLATLLAIGGR